MYLPALPAGAQGCGRVEYAAFGAGLGQVAGIATAEMCMKDLGLAITLGRGVAAAQAALPDNIGGLPCISLR